MPPAARVTDMHTCPLSSGWTPHVGGPVSTPGGPTVIIGGLPSATVGSMCICATGPPPSIVKGSASVLISGKPAARVGDSTSHGGVIVAGCPTVLIGDVGMGGPQATTMSAAKKSGAAFCEECAKGASA